MSRQFRLSNKSIQKITKIKSFGKISHEFTLEGTNSFLNIEEDEYCNNMEHCSYSIENLEQLEALLKIVDNLLKDHETRYIEFFVSAYQPEEQQVFLQEGYLPYGYVPSWFYEEKKELFKDAVVFCKFKGEVKNVRSAPENKLFLEQVFHNSFSS